MVTVPFCLTDVVGSGFCLTTVPSVQSLASTGSPTCADRPAFWISAIATSRALPVRVGTDFRSLSFCMFQSRAATRAITASTPTALNIAISQEDALR